MTRKFFTAVRSMAVSAASLLALGVASPGRAQVVYVADASGHVGVFDAAANTLAPLGNLNGFGISQVLGIGYDPSTDAVILADRFTNRVFTMNAQTGASALLFNSTGEFQGVAVKGGNIFGDLESAQLLDAFTSTGTELGPGASVPSHTHGMGIDPATGQLYIIGTRDQVIRRVNDNLTVGTTVVTANIPYFVDDLDFLAGDFLVTAFSDRKIDLINGVTGARSGYLTTAQLNSMGLTSGTTGVAVRFTPAAVPEPGSMAMLAGMGIGSLLAMMRLRRRR